MEDGKYRGYQLTANNPVENGFTHDWLKIRLQQFSSIEYWCMCDEVGKEGTYHTHLYFYSANAVGFKTVVKRFPGVHVEVALGRSSQNRAYVRKEGEKFNRQEDGTYSYTDSSGHLHEGQNFIDTFEEDGAVPSDSQSFIRGQSAEILRMVKEGASNNDIMDAFPSAFRDIDKIDRARSSYRDKQFAREWRDLHVEYIFGASGTGKTRSIVEQFGYENVYRVTDYKHPFDTYDGQDVIVFEEFRSGLKHGDMLNYLDGYPLLLPCRYFNRQACYTKVFIVSNISPEMQYPNIDDASLQAFYRRIHVVKEFDKLGRVSEYSGVKAYQHRFDFVQEIINESR